MVVVLWLAAMPVRSDGAPRTIRIASFNTELGRKGPGLFLRDVERGHTQVKAVVEVIATTKPDILLLLGIDWDKGNRGLGALADRLAEAGVVYPYRFAPLGNNGVATGLDLNGDGKRRRAADAMGYGRFTGAGGMALLSRFPIEAAKVQDLTSLLWKDMPGATLPRVEGRVFPSEKAMNIQRLSSKGHWVVPVELPGGRILSLMAFHATPPLFDGPEDRNGLRNADEISLWRRVLDGQVGRDPGRYFVILGDANLDPNRGAGRRAAMRALLSRPRVQDPSERDVVTVEWKRAKPPKQRVDYVLPSKAARVVGQGVFWPEKGAPGYRAARRASRHRLVWVDLGL